jgi:hypothetical protein
VQLASQSKWRPWYASSSSFSYFLLAILNLITHAARAIFLFCFLILRRWARRQHRRLGQWRVTWQLPRLSTRRLHWILSSIRCTSMYAFLVIVYCCSCWDVVFLGLYFVFSFFFSLPVIFSFFFISFIYFYLFIYVFIYVFIYLFISLYIYFIVTSLIDSCFFFFTCVTIFTPIWLVVELICWSDLIW